MYVNVFTIIGFAMSNFGLNNIIKISIPVLMILYPITIVIVVIVILNKFIKLSKKAMRLTIIMTTAASTIEVLVSTLNLKTVKSLISVFIGGNSGFLWVNFVVLGIVLSLLLKDKIKGESFEIKNQPL